MISIVEMTPNSFQLFQNEILHIENASFLSPWSVRSFTEEVDRLISRFLALKVDSRLSGYICFWIFAGEIHLMKMAIHPEMRGNGLGFFLLTRMIEEGRSEKSERVWLEVRLSNDAARALYEKAGFTEIGRRRGYYNNGKEDALVMTLNI